MKQPSKEDLIKKWSAILGPMGITGSQLDNISQLAENQSNHILEENTEATEFPTLLPTFSVNQILPSGPAQIP